MSYTLKTTHGILCLISGLFMLFKSTGAAIHIDGAPATLRDLDNLALANRLTHLWIHPSTRLEIFEIDKALLADSYIYPTWKYDEKFAQTVGKNPLVSYYGKVLFKRYDPLTPPIRTWNKFVVFLEHCLWDWPKDTTPQTLLTLIADLEGKLGVQMSGSPSGTGLRYLKKVHDAKLQVLEKPNTPLAALPWAESAKPLIWQRKPTEEELEAANYLLAVDKNAAYPRAAQEEQFGIGEPEHHQQVEIASQAIDFKTPGIFHIADCQMLEAPATTLMVQGLIPSPMARMAGEWVATPLLKALVKSGFSITCDECWTFPKYAPLFKRWVGNLWQMRQACEPESVLRDSVKQIMNDTLGLTRSQKFGESLMARPDWNAQVVAGSRANMLYNILKYAQYGYYPCMVQIDALYYLAKYPDPNMAIPGITAQSQSLGGYKLKWCLPLTGAVKNLVMAEMAQSKKLQQLNELSRAIVTEHVW